MNSEPLTKRKLMSEQPTQTKDGMHHDHDNWFCDALRRKMLRSVAEWDPENTGYAAHYRKLITEATTVGELIDILYYDWGLHNDVSQLTDTMSEACEERDIK